MKKILFILLTVTSITQSQDLRLESKSYIETFLPEDSHIRQNYTHHKNVFQQRKDDSLLRAYKHIEDALRCKCIQKRTLDQAYGRLLVESVDKVLPHHSKTTKMSELRGLFTSIREVLNLQMARSKDDLATFKTMVLDTAREQIKR
jgi:predicted RND superfamily exporter protein